MDTDSGGIPNSVSVDIIYLDAVTGDPIEGVHYVHETDVGRVEDISAADGTLSTTLEYFEPSVASLAAKEGYVIVGGNWDSIPALDGPLTIRLQPIRPTPSEGWAYSVSVTGVPAGGQACASLFGPGWFMQCAGAGADITGMAGASQVPHAEATVFAIDASGDVVDFLAVPFTADGRNLTATVAFDGAPDITPVVRSLTVDVPEGPLRTDGVLTFPWMLAALDGETGAIRSYLTNITPNADGSSLSMTYTAFPAPSPAAPSSHAIALFAMGRSQRLYVRSLHFFPGDLSGDTVSTSAAPSVDSGRELSAPFAWSGSSGALSYQVMITTGTGSPVYSLHADSGTSFTVPELPSTYDREVGYPFPDSEGLLSVQATYADEEPIPTPPTTEVEITNGDWHPITF